MAKKNEFENNKAAAQNPVTDEALSNVVGGLTDPDFPFPVENNNPNCPKDLTRLEISGIVEEKGDGWGVDPHRIKYKCPTCGKEYIDYGENGEHDLRPLNENNIDKPNIPSVIR